MKKYGIPKMKVFKVKPNTSLLASSGNTTLTVNIDQSGSQSEADANGFNGMKSVWDD